jgi:predicted nucleic-acid-binding Zn-ribbon protein
MAYSKCPKCDNTRFEVKENSPTHSNFKLLFVQCSSCGTVVGTMDYYNIGARLSEIEKKIDQIKLSSSGSSAINSNLDVINTNIARLFNYVKSKLDNK